MSFRTPAAGRGRGAGRPGHARPAARLRAREGAGDASRSSSRSPARTCWPRCCSTRTTRTTSELAHGDRRRAGRAGQAHRRRRRPDRRGEPAGQPGGMGVGGGRRSTACSTRSRRRRRCISASATTAARPIQKGGWGKLIDYLNALHVDHIVMENAHRPAEELAVFKDLRPEIGFGLGVVDIKQTVIEIGRSRSRARSSAPTRCWAPAA